MFLELTAKGDCSLLVLHRAGQQQGGVPRFGELLPVTQAGAYGWNLPASSLFPTPGERADGFLRIRDTGKRHTMETGRWSLVISSRSLGICRRSPVPSRGEGCPGGRGPRLAGGGLGAVGKAGCRGPSAETSPLLRLHMSHNHVAGTAVGSAQPFHVPPPLTAKALRLPDCLCGLRGGPQDPSHKALRPRGSRRLPERARSQADMHGEANGTARCGPSLRVVVGPQNRERVLGYSCCWAEDRD